MRKKQNGYHSQLCELPLYSRLGKLRAMQGNRIMDNACTSYCIWDRSSAALQYSSTLHAHDTAYEIAAQQLSSALHTHDTAYGIAAQQLSSSTSTAVQCMHKILQNGIAAQQLRSSAVHYSK
jgi:hypothetical protein